VQETYCNLDVGNWYMLHQQLAKFFQGRKVKVRSDEEGSDEIITQSLATHTANTCTSIQ